MKSLSYLNKYLFKYKYHLLLGTFFVVISNIFAIYPAQYIREAFDFSGESIKQYNLIANETDKLLKKEAIIKAAIWYGFLVLLMSLLKGVFTFFTRQSIIVMSRLIEYDLKNEVFNHYQNLNTSFYRRNNTGDIMNRISEDVSRVRMYLGPGIMYTLNLVTLFILVIATMININAKLTFYVLAPLPILAILIYYVSNAINKKSEQVQKQLSYLSTLSQETFSGIRIIKAFVKEKQTAHSFQKENLGYKTLTLGLVKINALFHPLMILLIGLSTILTIYIGGKEAIAGNISYGNIAEFVIYVNMLIWPVTSLGWVTSLIQRAAASQERINEFLKEKPDITNVSNEERVIKGKIEFKNVSFIYPDSNIEVLKNISFAIEQGQKIAIVGRTGSGKSTIAQLILRLYDVTTGEILIDGINIKEHNLNNIRSSIGFVPQEVFLFSDTIKNNIAFGYSKNLPGEDKIIKAAKDAAIYDNIMSFPKGMETLLGERGITLSGGQKQRVSISRAIIHKPQILLFDDCLSAVDTETEEEILKNLEHEMQHKTTLIISHRISGVKNADTILVLHNGSIAEKGNHEELMAINGIYAGMYKKQLLESINK
ncbi:MAG: ABC transporter ATP-binding protein [Bacteroidetes bacterium]|nr:ABC transporter ATP-binding protein [Bacteroidota bacterium]MCL4816310.1 ABC transporter ATP-binding protein/permease [Flavobacteriales bacterium]NOG95362.1 ABC transporter ATP-binding protein [Bacteroidota bacterium]WKZ76390.1 MAG: ABC transporter ATP-binding protein [Vicingaceae bacterium]